MQTYTLSSFRQVLTRCATPFFAFSVALMLLLMLSSALIVPRLTRIAVQGMLLAPPDVERYAAHVRDEIGGLQERVDEFVYPTRDPDYLLLRDMRAAALSPHHLRAAINDALARTPDAQGAVNVLHIVLHDDGSALIEGVVYGVGPRSITVLAGFVDALRDSPLVREVVPSPFQRVDDPVRGPSSPFSIRLFLSADVS